ncbi:MAG: cytochrome C oxidase subunit IV family protein, partial [Planctomycetota bacterium]
HIVPIRILAATGIALLFLTVVTVWIAKFDFGAANVFVALMIAAIKASLVVLFFMHLRWDRPFNSFIFVASIAFVALFISFALTDTIEYEEDVIPGNGLDVEQRLTELTGP